MTAWNDTFDGTLDWSAVAFLNMIRAAILERAGVLQSPPAVPAAVAAGDDVQGAVESGASVVGALQLALADVIDYTDLIYNEGYLDPDLVGGDWPGPMDFAAVRDKAGLSATSTYRRKRPREIDSTSAATDTEGNTIADGHRARLTVAPYGLWARTSGAWVPTPPADGPPDVLDTDAAAPFACSPSGNVHGAVAEGDYIGPWLFADLRDMCNALTVTGQHFGTIGTEAYREGSSGVVGSFVTAKSDAETAFDAATPGASGGWGSWTEAYYVGGSYQGSMQRGQWHAYPVNDPGGLARDVEWWGKAAAPAAGGSPVANFFDGFPDAPPVVLGWSNFHTSAGDTSADPSFVFPTDNTSHPAWPPAPTSGVPGKSNGWVMADNYFVLRWGVVGGFAYTAST